MRSPLEALARRLWADDLGGAGRPLRALLTPLSWLWRLATGLRNRRYDRRGSTVVPGLCVVSVGNLAVGGTGKTPLAGWIARFYADRGHRVAVIIRGYGGDEPLLHRRWSPDVPVIVDPDRTRGARAAVEEGRSVVVLDDGFQHRRLARSLDLVVLAAEQGWPKATLPVGPFREGVDALARASAAIVSRRTASVVEARRLADAVAAQFPGSIVAGFRLVGGRWTDLGGDPCPEPAGDVLAVAGVGRPHTFFAAVRSLLPGSGVEGLPLADHRSYRRSDVERLVRRADGRTLVVTEKDAVKLLAHADLMRATVVLGQDVQWDWGEREISGLLADVAGAPPASGEPSREGA